MMRLYTQKKQYLKHALEEEAKIHSESLNAPPISEEIYKKDILPFWEKYDQKPERFWFEYFGSRDSIAEPRFIPSVLYYNEIVPYINNLQMRYALTDKNFYEQRFPDVKQAKSIFHKIAGLYYDPSMHLIDVKEAVKLCLIGDLIKI